MAFGIDIVENTVGAYQIVSHSNRPERSKSQIIGLNVDVIVAHIDLVGYRNRIGYRQKKIENTCYK